MRAFVVREIFSFLSPIIIEQVFSSTSSRVEIESRRERRKFLMLLGLGKYSRGIGSEVVVIIQSWMELFLLLKKITKEIFEKKITRSLH